MSLRSTARSTHTLRLSSVADWSSSPPTATTHFVLDMAEVPFIDSSGLGVLVGAYKRARTHRGCVCLLNPDARLTKLLSVTGLSKVFHTFDDLQEALDYLNDLDKQ